MARVFDRIHSFK